MGIKKGASALWYSELGLHQLGSRPTAFIPRWTTHPCILYQVCATRGAACCCRSVRAIRADLCHGASLGASGLAKLPHKLNMPKYNCYLNTLLAPFVVAAVRTKLYFKEMLHKYVNCCCKGEQYLSPEIEWRYPAFHFLPLLSFSLG